MLRINEDDWVFLRLRCFSHLFLGPHENGTADEQVINAFLVGVFGERFNVLALESSLHCLKARASRVRNCFLFSSDEIVEFFCAAMMMEFGV